MNNVEYFPGKKSLSRCIMGSLGYNSLTTQGAKDEATVTFAVLILAAFYEILSLRFMEICEILKHCNDPL